MLSAQKFTHSCTHTYITMYNILAMLLVVSFAQQIDCCTSLRHSQNLVCCCSVCIFWSAQSRWTWGKAVGGWDHQSSLVGYFPVRQATQWPTGRLSEVGIPAWVAFTRPSTDRYSRLSAPTHRQIQQTLNSRIDWTRFHYFKQWPWPWSNLHSMKSLAIRFGDHSGKHT